MYFRGGSSQREKEKKLIKDDKMNVISMDGLQSNTKILYSKSSIQRMCCPIARLGFCSPASAFYPPLDDQVRFFRVNLKKNLNFKELLSIIETDFFFLFLIN